MEIAGWIMALVIGLTLGLLGGGGSILTVPVLVYLLGIDPVVSTGYSLFIVGLSALVGAISYYKKRPNRHKNSHCFWFSGNRRSIPG
jgi:hypothetical protein